VTSRPLSAVALAAILAVCAPVALADGPGTGDQSPSYGGSGTANDHTAPYLRATILTRHLGALAQNGKLKLSLASSEAALVGLTGTLTARRPHATALRVKLKGATLLFQRAGAKGATLTLSSAARAQLKGLVRAGGKQSRGTVTVTGLGTDRARNKRHLKKSAGLVR
jgi:hypothetical protein